MRKKGADPALEPEQPDDEADQKSNLHKVALSGFAVAIVVMVLINFFGLLGSKEPQEPSIQKNKSAAQKAAPKKRSNVVAQKPKKSTAPKTPRRKAAVQKRSPKPASSPRGNQTTKKSSIQKPPSRKIAAVTSSLSQPSAQTNGIAKRPASQNLPPQKNPPEPQVNSFPETKTVQASSPPSSPPKTQKTTETAFLASRANTPSYRYSVYLGAYKTLERARVAVSQYQKKGVSSYWVKVDLGRKGIWHRLFTGHFQEGGTALDFINNRDLEGASVKKTRYATLVGAYSSEDAIIKKSQALDKLGYSSYIVDGGNGTSQLYSGAFITKGGAEKHYQELAAKGIRNRVVER
jgi:cell division septation protein DedD